MHCKVKTDRIIIVYNWIILNSEGNVIHIHSYDTLYNKNKFSAANKVQSVSVYNPKTNFIDDIPYRTDTVIKLIKSKKIG